VTGGGTSPDLARAVSWPPSWSVTWLTETGSTNSDLAAAARAGAPAGTVIVADVQRAGRGRLDRSWVAPPGSSLLCSILLRPSLPLGQLHRCTQAVALAAVDACEQVAGVRPSLKWPNDLLIDGRKLAGVLAESVMDGDRVAGVVIGIGINVNWPQELPDDLAAATSLSHVVDPARLPLDRVALLDALLAAMPDPSSRALSSRYRRALATIGQRVRVERASGDLLGTAIDVTDDGLLVVQPDGGLASVEISVADITHLRLADSG
jgi:BirA family transcriptional regulator, biotin operon repressor / biotin---[acetyl-CoA-carboxylase] ligase